jgi:hypothetical protein
MKRVYWFEKKEIKIKKVGSSLKTELGDLHPSGAILTPGQKKKC